MNLSQGRYLTMKRTSILTVTFIAAIALSVRAAEPVDMAQRRRN